MCWCFRSLRIFCWFCWGCFSKALIFYMRISEWSGAKNWNRTNSFPAPQNQMSHLLWDFSPSTLYFWNVFQKFHLEPVKPFTKWVIVAWKLWWWLILLWNTFLAELSRSKKLWAMYFGDHLWFCLLLFMPKLKHFVEDLPKISILRLGIQKHRLILETLACSIQILAAAKKHSFKMDTLP